MASTHVKLTTRTAWYDEFGTPYINAALLNRRPMDHCIHINYEDHSHQVLADIRGREILHESHARFSASGPLLCSPRIRRYCNVRDSVNLQIIWTSLSGSSSI